MPPPVSAATAAVASFARRAALGSFVGGACRALTAVALAAALMQLGARLLGSDLVPTSWWAPSPWWTLAALPVLAAGWLAMRRERLAPAVAAAHLDRRLGADGLLLAAHGAPPLDASWRARLDASLARLPEALPRIRWSRLLPVPLAAVAFAAGLALLPPPPAPSAPLPQLAVTAELERLAAQLEKLTDRGQVPEAVQRELDATLQQLEQRNAAGQRPDWRELDALGERIAREQLLQNLARAAASTRDAGKADAKTLAAAAQALAASGLLDKLPADLAAQLGAARQADGSFAADLLPQDLAALQALAKAMADAAGQLAGEAGQGAGVAGMDAQQIADLQATLAKFGHGGATGQGQSEGEGEGEGRGGVSRGPGHAALALTEDAVGSADQAMPLPKGAAVPSDWVPIGESRRDPIVDPQASGTAGSAGAAGRLGASWQLDLAPRHRAVVRRYFEAAGQAAPGRENK